MMPKLHKKEFSMRALVSCIDHPTSSICFFMDFVCKQYVSKLV
jgi:hypothetical protein